MKSTEVQRSHQGWVTATLLLGLGTFVAATYALGAEARQAGTLGNPAYAGWARVLFQAAALLTLNDPGAPGREPFLGLARLGAIAFALSATVTVVLSLSGNFSAFVGRTAVRVRSRLLPARAHTVVVGLDRIGLQLATDLYALGRPVIAVAARQEDPHAAAVRRAGALVLAGSAREPSVWGRTYPRLAREVFVVSDDDAVNIELAGEVLRSLRGAPNEGRWSAWWNRRPARLGPVECHVHIGEPQLSQVFQTDDVFQAPHDAVEYHVVNVRDAAARQLLRDDTRGLARPPYAPADDEVAHYVLFGFGETGQAVALHMARLAHFGNGRRLRLTVFDDFGRESVRRAYERFMDRHPGFCPAPAAPAFRGAERWPDADADRWASRAARPADPEWRIDAQPHAVEYAVNAEFLDVPTDVDAPSVLARLGARLGTQKAGPAVKPGVVVCFDDDRRNFQAALRLRGAMRRIAARAGLAAEVPTYVYLPSQDGLATLLETATEADPAFPLYAFGRIGQTAGYDQVAKPALRRLGEEFRLAYERLEARRAGPGGVAPHPAPAAPSPPSGQAARLPSVFRLSNEEAAAHALLKLDAIGYHVRRARAGEAAAPAPTLSAEQIARLAEVEHNRYMAERLVAGWRYGPDRDDVGRRRPSFLAWEHLTDKDERAKDESQVAALVEAYARAGYVVEPNGAEPPAVR